ncbi:IS66 family transposase [Pseudomonas putida]|uniref:IS66 family transposase n=1 Tax=Pseudomonas putida TaxID=303 RepID=UPI00352868B9
MPKQSKILPPDHPAYTEAIEAMRRYHEAQDSDAPATEVERLRLIAESLFQAVAEKALHSIGGLYEVERQAKDMSDEDRWRLCQEMAVPIAEKLHEWMLAQRELVPEGSATTKALDYSLKRWIALTRYLGDGAVPTDNNAVENTIRPWALGRSNWLFAGSLRSGKRAAASMSLIQSACMNGHDPYSYLKDVLTRLPTHRASKLHDLLPHVWSAVTD